ncbi:MAG: 3'-5' exonuclease [Bacteroidetes bacterium]|nr:3'-5' exonuclease [Bacteroidota bacterium]
MLENYKVENILFIDVETVPEHPDYSELSDQFKKLWNKKVENLRIVTEGQNPSDKAIYYRAAIYAEFGKIVCISVGHLVNKNGERTLRMKSYSGDDEKALLQDFTEMLKKYSSSNPGVLLCAHNGKEFDFPYLSRRMLINGLQIPKMLDLSGKKPWEVNHLDTMELWKFGDYKSYTSLNLLTAVFNIPTSKDDIDGSDVARVYWEEKDMPRIVKYCQKDVVAIVQLFLKLKGEALIKTDNIEYAE